MTVYWSISCTYKSDNYLTYIALNAKKQKNCLSTTISINKNQANLTPSVCNVDFFLQ